MLCIHNAMTMKLTIIRLPRQIQSLWLVLIFGRWRRGGANTSSRSSNPWLKGEWLMILLIDTPDDVEDLCETKYCKVLGPCNCWISSKLNVLGMFSHRETSSRTGCRVSPLRASLAKTMVVRTAKSNTSIGNP